MRSILWLIAVIVCASAERERVGANTKEATDNLSRKLWVELKKRLQDDYGMNVNDLDALDGVADPQCDTDITNRSIISTHESIKNGALYIDSPSVRDKEECIHQCCSQENCNIAVYKDKDDHVCYLFDCGTPSVCIFTPHPEFSIIHLPLRQTGDKRLQKHEDDLANLITDPPTSTSSMVTTTTTQVPSVAVPVSLYEECTSHKDCAGSLTICLAGYCVCKQGYHAQEGNCRKDCTNFEFACANEGKPMSYPQCIAIYDRCDGIQHCGDGSDERRCDDKKEDASKVAEDGDDSSARVVHDDEVAGKPGKQAPDNGKPVFSEDQRPIADGGKDGGRLGTGQHLGGEDAFGGDHMTHGNGVSMAGTDGDDDVSMGGSHGDNDVSKGDGDSDNDDSKIGGDDADHAESQPTKLSDSDRQSEDTAGSDVSSDASSSQQVEEEAAKGGDKKEEGEQIPASTGDDSGAAGKAKVVVLSNQHGDDQAVINKAEEQVGEADTESAGFYQANKGAVVALSLGLALTALLLVFVGCRLKNVRRHVRRGRPLTSNEADYLVNGMYL